MTLLRLAARNLARNFRRTVITVLSIGWGLAVILWIQAILNGSNHNIVETITSTYYGHMQIFREDYLAEKMITQSYQWDPSVLPKFKNTEIFASPRAFLPALVSTGEQSTPIILQGIDPEAEARITVLKKSLIEGEYLKPEAGEKCESRSLYISQSLSKLLSVGVGEKIVILAQAADGSMGNELFRVTGIFNTGSPEYDRGVVVSTHPCVKATGVLGGIHEVALRVEGSADHSEVKAAIAKALPQGQVVRTWREVSPNLASMLGFNDGSVILVSVMLFVLIALGILNTFLTSIFERTKEFGVMMALGVSARSVIITVLCEAVVLGVAAALVGILVGGAIIFYHSQVGFDIRPFVGKGFSIGAFKMSLHLYPVMNWAGAAKATFSTMLVVAIAGFYPAYRASRLRPAEAIRSR